MIKYIKETITPVDVVRPGLDPAFKEVFDLRDEIIKKYTPADTGLTFSKETGDDGITVTTMYRYFESIEQFEKCFAELTEIGKTHISANDATMSLSQHVASLGISHRYQLRDATTDELLQDWTKWN